MQLAGDAGRRQTFHTRRPRGRLLDYSKSDRSVQTYSLALGDGTSASIVGAEADRSRPCSSIKLRVQGSADSWLLRIVGGVRASPPTGEAIIGWMTPPLATAYDESSADQKNLSKPSPGNHPNTGSPPFPTQHTRVRARMAHAEPDRMLLRPRALLQHRLRGGWVEAGDALRRFDRLQQAAASPCCHPTSHVAQRPRVWVDARGACSPCMYVQRVPQLCARIVHDHPKPRPSALHGDGERDRLSCCLWKIVNS